jgi:membrane-bound ClpP family serine protease
MIPAEMAFRRLCWMLLAVGAAATMPLVFAARATTPASSYPSGSAAASSSVLELRMEGEIEPILAEYIVNGIQPGAVQRSA